eukprot:CFRG1743T1
MQKNPEAGTSASLVDKIFCPHCHRTACEGKCLDVHGLQSDKLYYNLLKTNDIKTVIKDTGGGDGRYIGLALKLLLRIFCANIDKRDSFVGTLERLCYTKNISHSLHNEHHVLMSSVKAILGCGNEGLGWLSRELVEGVYGRIRLNSFGFDLYAPDGSRHRLSALYDTASYFNHSCTPNAEVRSDGGCIEIVTNTPVEKGEEIYLCYDYENEGMDVAERKRKLWMNYGFECNCRLCRDVDINRNVQGVEFDEQQRKK